MKNLPKRSWLHVVGLAGLLFGLVASGCDGILGIHGFEAGCTEGMRRCSPSYGRWPQTCDARGVWQNEQPCGPDLACDSGECVTACTPGTKDCDGKTPRECNADRAWNRLDTCSTDCNEGNCVNPCETGEIRCIGNAPATCTDGRWEASGTCFEKTCVDGACQGECAFPTKRCLADMPQTCNAVGLWEDSTPCETGQFCSAGSCTCAAGDRRCFENRPQLCDGSNQWMSIGETCKNQACDPKGTCVGSCEPGKKQCLGNVSQQCTSKGEWQSGETCSLGCFDGACAICTPNALRCTGNLPEGCNENGQWQDQEACVNQTCVDGTCQGQCTSGAKRCSVNYPQTCNANGMWENSLASCGSCGECNDESGACHANPLPTATCNQPTLLDVGAFHTCVLQPNATIQCWGYNAAGQLGLGDVMNRGDEVNEMGMNLKRVDLGPGVSMQDVRAGTAHTCGLLSKGGIKCWGENAFGQLGLGDITPRGTIAGQMGTNLPTVDVGGLGAIAMSAGETHTCAILTNGNVKCWGGNFYGQLGIGDTLARGDQADEMGGDLKTVDLGNGATAAIIRAGDMHTCAKVSPIDVKCWGNNEFGQLGLGDTNHRGDTPNEMGDALERIALELPPGIIVKDIGAGATHTCVLLSNGTVKCWGNNVFGQLGLGDTKVRGDESNEMGAALPEVEMGLGLGVTVTAISAGGGHTCALLSNGSVKCWGRNDVGQLGLGDTANRGDEPNEMGDALPSVNLGAGASATAIHAGHNHTCALLSSGRVKCWGRNLYGQLGLSDTVTRGDEPKDMGDGLPPVKL